MSRLNKVPLRPKLYTHEGALAFGHATALQQLRRSVLSCMLWESEFYESGEDIGKRIQDLVPKVPAEQVAALAVEAREKMNLRHIPLLLICELTKYKTHRHVVAQLAERVIQRADELAEVLAIYQRGRTGTKKLNKLSKQLQKGIARAFTKFNSYQLAKYNRDAEVKLRDVLFLVHAKPKDSEQEALWKQLVDDKLPVPDTWEVALSGTKGEGKREVWERLLREQQLGALALLRNLRNMKESNVQEKLVREALESMRTERILPFRFVAAAKHAPQWEPELEQAMFKNTAGMEKLAGKTCVVVDNSGSMYGAKISAKSDMDRSDAACALAMLVREICEQAVIISFSTQPRIVPSRRGFALRDAIKQATTPSSTNTDHALALAQQEGYDRIIVITDEQSHQQVRNPSYNGLAKLGYFVNVASYQNGVGYGHWLHLDGFSEAIIQYIQALEREEQAGQ